MEQEVMRKVRRGELYYYDFGEHEGSIQSGIRPVLVIQCNEGNQASTTTVVAAITTAIKKRYMPCHIVLGRNYGLREPSMVLLEQISTINQSDLQRYIGYVDDETVIHLINNGIKKALGLWVYNPQPKGEVRCLCGKCLADYKNNSCYLVKRLNPFSRIRERCDKCDGLGYDYLLTERKPPRIMSGGSHNE